MTMSEAVNPYNKSLMSTPHMLACFGRRKPILAIRNFSFVPKRQAGWTLVGNEGMKLAIHGYHGDDISFIPYLEDHPS